MSSVMSCVLPFHLTENPLWHSALLALVGLHVLGEVVAAHEALATVRAGEALLTRVRAQVSLQLVGARETLPTE